MTIAAAATNEVTRVFVSVFCPSPHSDTTSLALALGPTLVNLAPRLPPDTCLPAQGGGPEPHGPKRGTYAPQKGSREPGACWVSTGAGGGIVLALVTGTWVKVRVQRTGDLGLQEDASETEKN